MKKSNKVINIFIIMFIIVLINYGVVFADPDSSKGFLTYTEEQAEEERQELIKAQENNNTIAEVKSTNNYLKELSVDGYKITPNFDKQTVNYELKKEVKSDSILIKAEVDDESATVTGIGEVTLNDGENEIRIDVTAESGTVRTYYIKAVKKANGISVDEEDRAENRNDVKENGTYRKHTVIIIAAVILLTLIIVIAIKKAKRK